MPSLQGSRRTDAVACCRGRSLCSGASPSPTCCAKVPPPIGPPTISATRCTPCPWWPGWRLPPRRSPCARCGSPAIDCSPGSPPPRLLPLLRRACHAWVRRRSRHRPSGERAVRACPARRRTRRSRPGDPQCGRSGGQREHRKGRGHGRWLWLGWLRGGTCPDRRNRIIDDAAYRSVPDPNSHRHRRGGHWDGSGVATLGQWLDVSFGLDYQASEPRTSCPDQLFGSLT